MNNVISVVKENDRLGFVGNPVKLFKDYLDKVIKEGKVPVIAPLGLDDKNLPYNINADTAAGYIAKYLNARRLIIISDVEGVLDEKKEFNSRNKFKVSQRIDR